MEDDRLVVSNYNGKYYYNRVNSTSQNILCEKLTERHTVGDKILDTVLFPSGLSSIYYTTKCAIDEYKYRENTVQLFYSDELYCDTPFIMNSFYEKDKVEVEKFDVDNFKINWDKKSAVIILAEACSNPNGKIFPFSKISDMRSQIPNLYIIIDNTWLTDIIFNPFIHNIDAVCLSLTKYYSGGQCIAGATIGLKSNIFSEIESIIHLVGLHVSPLNIDIIIGNLDKMAEKIRASSKRTIEIINAIKKNVEVRHPFLADQSEINFNGIYPSVISFIVISSVNRFKKHCAKNLGAVEYKTSFGAKRTRIDTYPHKAGQGKTMGRIAVGFADDDFDEVLSEIIEVSELGEIKMTIPLKKY